MNIRLRSIAVISTVSILSLVARRASAEDAPPASTAAPTAKVHVVGAPTAQLETKSEGAWVSACDAPCDETLAAGTYRVSGPGVVASRPFRLATKDTRDVTLKVNAGKVGGLVGGVVLVSVGATLLPVGALLFVAVAGARGSAGGALFGAGVATVALGIGGIVLGSILIAGNAHTYVEQRHPIKANEEDAHLRVPTFRERGVEDVAFGSTWTAPVVGGTF